MPNTQAGGPPLVCNPPQYKLKKSS
jgi:hypothetical protein